MEVGGRYPIGGSEIAVPKHRRTEALHPVIGNAIVVVKIASGDLRRGSTSGSLGRCARNGAAKHEPAARMFKKGFLSAPDRLVNTNVRTYATTTSDLFLTMSNSRYV
jgi:hypothetical protein